MARILAVEGYQVLTAASGAEDLLQTEPRFGGKLLEHPPGPDFTAVVEETTLKDKSTLYAATPIKAKKMGAGPQRRRQRTLAPL